MKSAFTLSPCYALAIGFQLLHVLAMLMEYCITPTPKRVLWAMLASVLELNQAYLLGKSLEVILNQHEELKIITLAFMLRNSRV